MQQDAEYDTIFFNETQIIEDEVIMQYKKQKKSIKKTTQRDMDDMDLSAKTTLEDDMGL